MDAISQNLYPKIGSCHGSSCEVDSGPQDAVLSSALVRGHHCSWFAHFFSVGYRQLQKLSIYVDKITIT